jgi:hypothetical protein
MRNKKNPKHISIVLAALLALAAFSFAGVGCEGDETYVPVVSLSSTNPPNLVDSRKHCDWDARGSKYHDLIVQGTNMWNSYKPGIFRPDSITVIQDVRISDYTDVDDGIYGYTNKQSAVIKLNSGYLDRRDWDEDNRKHTIYHELGHVLGLGENNNGLATTIMKQGKLKNVTLSADDKASFDAAYKLYSYYDIK